MQFLLFGQTGNDAKDSLPVGRSCHLVVVSPVGIHSTISGVILAFVIPARPRLDAGRYIKHIRAVVNCFPVSHSDNIVLDNEQIAKLKRVERASDLSSVRCSHWKIICMGW